MLASLHERAGHGPDQLLQRYASAMKHPLVHAHHASDQPASCRTGPATISTTTACSRLAVDTGTVVEIDGAPSHLDLDGALARRAVAAGATVAIDSDCHRAEMLGRQMDLGIFTARRGWVEPRHVLNTRPLADVRVAHRRQARAH